MVGSRTEQKWNNIQSCRQARQLLQNSSNKFAKYAVRLARKDLKILVGLLTGHNTINLDYKSEFDFAEDRRGSYVPSLWRRI